MATLTSDGGRITERIYDQHVLYFIMFEYPATRTFYYSRTADTEYNQGDLRS